MSLSAISVSRITRNQFLHLRSTKLYVSNINNPPSNIAAVNGDDSDEDDEMIIENTPTSTFQDLCSQLGLSTIGSKEILLERLRDYANEQSKLERQRQLERKTRVEEGTGNDKERYEIIDDTSRGDDEDVDVDGVAGEENGYLFIHISDNEDNKKQIKETRLESDLTTSSSTIADSNKPCKQQGKWKNDLSKDVITAPPSHLVEPNEKGERVFTVYSTKDQNDLTGVAASQPGQASSNDPMMSGADSSPGMDASWDNSKLKGKVSESEIDKIEDDLTELIQSFLAMTGAPAFQDEFDDTQHQLEAGGVFRRPSYSSPHEGFTGFDPAQVPVDLLTKCSKALRANRGKVLQDVMRKFELRAVGYDGTAGDDKSRGGGHYKEVSKVGAFLEGVRRAEVNKIARETVTILLGKMVTEGIEGIDVTLSAMARGSDDTSDDAGELNDALLDYLNDIVRQQERKIEHINAKAQQGRVSVVDSQDDEMEKLWRVEEEDGERIETFDMNDPKTKSAIQAEYERTEREVSYQRPVIPSSIPEQLLLLLKLLRDRVKTEAVFAHDEKSLNLRVLAYCMHASSSEERIQILERELGSSFDVSL